MNTDYLKTFLEVASSGSFSKASEKLYLSKQAVMNQMNRLEKEIGVPLLSKSPRGILLTKEGNAFARWASGFVSDEQKMLKELREIAHLQSRLRLANIDYHVLLPPVTEAFHQRYPETVIENVFHYETLEARLVSEGIIDVGDMLSLTAIDRKSLRYEKLLDMPYFCILPEPYPDRIISPSQLRHMQVAVDGFEFRDEYIVHLPILQKAIPHLEIMRCTARRIDVVYRILHRHQAFITAATYARNIKGFSMAELDIGLSRECGIVYRRNAGIEVKQYVSLAHEIYE